MMYLKMQVGGNLDLHDGANRRVGAPFNGCVVEMQPENGF